MMFSLKPILVDQQIILPTCMYKLKSVGEGTNEGMSDSNSKSEKSEVELLEEKQSRILKKLEELKQSLMLMRGDLKLCNKPFQPPQQNVSSAAKTSKLPIDVTNLGDLVINVHPLQIPYGLLGLKNQWKGRMNIEAKVFIHSSISQVSESARDFALKISTPSAQSNLPTLNVVIIWKDVELIQLVISSATTPIIGEVNVVRFFNRIGPSEFSYEDRDKQVAALSDIVFDTCYQLSQKHLTKERPKHLQILSQRLNKQQFFSGSSGVSVVDIAVASVIENLYGKNIKDLPANILAWHKKIASFVGF